MEATAKSAPVSFTEEEGDDTTQPTVEQRLKHNFFRRRRVADNDAVPEGVVTATSIKRPHGVEDQAEPIPSAGGTNTLDAVPQGQHKLARDVVPNIASSGESVGKVQETGSQAKTSQICNDDQFVREPPQTLTDDPQGSSGSIRELQFNKEQQSSLQDWDSYWHSVFGEERPSRYEFQPSVRDWDSYLDAGFDEEWPSRYEFLRSDDAGYYHSAPSCRPRKNRTAPSTLGCQGRKQQARSSVQNRPNTTSSLKGTLESLASAFLKGDGIPSNVSVPTKLSGDTSSGGKRRRKEPGQSDERPQKKRRVSKEKSGSSPRLACFYNKYDPMVYRSSAQSDRRFEICETHGFANMNRLYEHLKRIHCHPPLQCPRCTRTDFQNSEELQAHQTASEPCLLVSLTAVKRMKWSNDKERKALQAAVNRQSADLRRLGACTEEDRWKIAYRWLFPDSNHTPYPYLQDPMKSIVSCVVNELVARLWDLTRHSSDLHDLVSQIPAIREQLLARYDISVDAQDYETHQDQTLVLPSISSRSQLSSVAEAAPRPILELSNTVVDDGFSTWLQHDNTMLAIAGLDTISHAPNSMAIESHMSYFAEFETSLFGSASGSLPYEVLGSIQ